MKLINSSCSSSVSISGSLSTLAPINGKGCDHCDAMPPTAGSVPAVTAPTPKILNSIFPLCKTLSLLQQLHAQILLHGLHLSAFFGSRLAHSYFESGSPRNACRAFDQIPSKTPHSWNTMLAGYSKAQNPFETLQLYKLSRAEDRRPDSFSLVFAIRASARLSLLKEGRSMHSEAIRSGLDSHAHVAPALINMYIESGSLEDAERVFDRVPVTNPAAWGLMMKGYLKASMDIQIFELFERMRELGLELDPCCAVSLARACGNVCAAKEGSVIHGFCLKKNFFDSNVYLQTSLIDMYGKSGFVDFALRLFDEMPCKDVVSWSAIIAGLAQSGRAYQSLRLFRNMLEEWITPNEVTLASVLLACSHLGALQQGKSVHGYIVRNEIRLDVVNYTTLIDMYAKCGPIGLSYKVFNAMPERNVFSWSAMIGGFGMHGMCLKALTLFDHMRAENIVPNSVTFVSVLSACSHSGKVQEGRCYFESMSKDYKIAPTNEHYSCMVDLLGRAGLIDEAESLIKKIPLEPSASVWGALLGACRIHKRVELAERVANELFVLEPDKPDTHVLLSNIYAAAEMWEMAKKTREGINASGLQKSAGFSSIEVDKRIYIFNGIYNLECQSTRIMELWRVLSNQMKEFGYRPDHAIRSATLW